jgi:hypothetical protein
MRGKGGHRVRRHVSSFIAEVQGNVVDDNTTRQKHQVRRTKEERKEKRELEPQ